VGVRHHVRLKLIFLAVAFFIIGVVLTVYPLFTSSSNYTDVARVFGGMFIGQVTLVIPEYLHARELDIAHRKNALAAFLLGVDVSTIALGGTQVTSGWAKFLGRINAYSIRLNLGATLDEKVSDVDSIIRSTNTQPMPEIKNLLEYLEGLLQDSHPSLYNVYEAGTQIPAVLNVVVHISDPSYGGLFDKAMNNISLQMDKAGRNGKNRDLVQEIAALVLDPLRRFDNQPTSQNGISDVVNEVEVNIEKLRDVYTRLTD
jgi:hypothetical protein